MKINIDPALDNVLPAEKISQSENVVAAGRELVERAYNKRIAVGIAARVVVLSLDMWLPG
jgi:hypothetical protein